MAFDDNRLLRIKIARFNLAIARINGSKIYVTSSEVERSHKTSPCAALSRDDRKRRIEGTEGDGISLFLE